MKCKINEIRRSKRIKLKDLAEQAGISRITLWRIETDQTSPNFQTILKISKVLEVQENELFDAA